MSLSRRARIVLAIAAVVVVGLVVLRWQWYPIRVRMILASSAPDQEKIEKIREFGKRAVPSLIGIFESGSGSWAGKELVGRILVHEPFRRVVVLERTLGSGSVLPARVAAYLLVETRNTDKPDEIFRVLRSWFDDRAFEHRARLTLTLAKLGRSDDGRVDDRCVDLLGKILTGRSDESAIARGGAADALGGPYKEVPEGLQPLLDAARGDPDEGVRARALRSLGVRGWSEDMELYERGLTAELHKNRMFLASGLGQLGEVAEPLLGKLIEDEVPYVRRSALGSLGDIRSSLIDEHAERLREDWYMGVRGDLALVIQDLQLENRVPVLIQSLREKEPDENNHVIRKTIQALFKLTGKCYGFPEDFFRAVRYDWKREKAIMKEWFETPAEEKEKALAEWEKEFGTYDRRPALLAQMRHADPANVAWAVRELHAMNPDAPTPGFEAETVRAALGNHDPEAEPFQALVEAAKAFQGLPELERKNVLDAWEKAGR
jgi:hypothetical protein